MSRATGVDIITGAGLDDHCAGLDAALSGAEVITDAAAGPSAAQQPATEFFATAAHNLQQAAARRCRLNHQRRQARRRLRPGQDRARGRVAVSPDPGARRPRRAVPRVRGPAARMGHAGRRGLRPGDAHPDRLGPDGGRSGRRRRHLRPGIAATAAAIQTRLGSRSWTFGRLNTLTCGFTSQVDEIGALQELKFRGLRRKRPGYAETYAPF
jgi:hypothetical protein